jgi:outer membrane protein TolC
MRFESLVLAVSLATAISSGALAGDERAPGSSVESLLDYARANPEYAAMRYEADAAAARVHPAGALADPALRVELENITNAGSSASPSLIPSKVGDTKYTILQPIPFWGKRDLKREAAASDADQAQGRAAMTWAELSTKVKTLYAQYYVAVHNESLTSEILDLLARLESIAEVRYASGLAPQQDVIRAQVERTNLRGELVMLESEEQGLRAALNKTLARGHDAPLALPWWAGFGSCGGSATTFLSQWRSASSPWPGSLLKPVW